VDLAGAGEDDVAELLAGAELGVEGLRDEMAGSVDQ
jgi:hypothetical protein